ncbi:hypothetical protein Unana1_04191 [Umbelopsis nana]
MDVNVSRFEKAPAEDKPSKKDLLSLSRKRKVTSPEQDALTKRPALKPSNGEHLAGKSNPTDHIADKLQNAHISKLAGACDKQCAHGEGSSKTYAHHWGFMMYSQPKKESKKEQKALGMDSVKKENADSDEELWKQASQIAADEEPKSEDENMEDTEPDTPSFDDMPSPVVQALIEQLEQDNDTPMIPDYSYADKDNAEEEDAEADDAEEGDTIEEDDSNRVSNAEEPKDESGTPVVRSKVPGENTFSHECVKTWSPARIHAWEIRRLNPEAFYYHPAQGQNNGSFTKTDHENFMKRMEVWKSKGYRIGASWGIFSMGIPHRAGYQCSSYYRKLIQSKKIQDDAYAMVDGKLKMVDKNRTNAGEIATSELSPAWQTDEVKEIEREVDQWLKEYHNRSGSIVAKKPAAPKPKAAPRVYKSTTSKSGDIAALVKQNIGVGDFRLLTDEEAFMLAAEPSAIKVRRRNWDLVWNESLQEYRKFVESFQDPDIRRKYHEMKKVWRKGLSTTESTMSLRKQAPSTPAASVSSMAAPAVKKPTQLSLANFFAGVKKVKPKVDTPDDLISRCVIPNELFSGVKNIRGLYNEKRIPAAESKMAYWEVKDMDECLSILEEALGSIDSSSSQSPIEGMLIDPPWEFYVADGRNDGRCTWSLMQMMTFMDKVLQYMSAGLIFMWTHKSTQADVVRMMYSLGCKYVENLVWFKKTLSNVLQDRPNPYFSSTKEILLIFKRGDGFELRHQRTADVIIDFERPTEQWIHEEYTELKPPGVYDMIETLLPKAGFDRSFGRGRLLELWAKQQTPRREGWLAFHNIKSAVDASKHNQPHDEDISELEPMGIADSEMDMSETPKVVKVDIEQEV